MTVTDLADFFVKLKLKREAEVHNSSLTFTPEQCEKIMRIIDPDNEYGDCNFTISYKSESEIEKGD